VNSPRILIIAGSDSGGGAGIQADIKTVTMFGGYAMTAITALTAQNSLEVSAVLPVPTDMVLAQIDAVASDIGVDAVKIGMIGSADTANAVAERLAGLPADHVIFDPVMVATSGAVLADDATISAFSRLAARASLVTPNGPELARLTGMRVDHPGDAEAAAQTLASASGTAVLAKGGDMGGSQVRDCLAYPDGRVVRWASVRIDTPHSHGTGCTLASAVATLLARGHALEEAIGLARDYVLAAIRAAPPYGAGHGPMGHALGVVPFDVIRAQVGDKA